MQNLLVDIQRVRYPKNYSKDIKSVDISQLCVPSPVSAREHGENIHLQNLQDL